MSDHVLYFRPEKFAEELVKMQQYLSYQKQEESFGDCDYVDHSIRTPHNTQHLIYDERKAPAFRYKYVCSPLNA